MSPLDYVKNFCVIKRRRKKLYQDIYMKHREKSAGAIPFKVCQYPELIQRNTSFGPLFELKISSIFLEV